MTILSNAPEKGTFVLTAAFTDSAGTAVIPKTATWTLTDSSGTVINSRSAVAFAAPLAATESVTLTGLDLAIQANGDLNRIWTVQYTYDSTEGTDCPMSGEAAFRIDDRKIIT